MSTTMNVPAHILARQQQRKASDQKSAIMSAVISGDGFPFPKISIRASKYRLVEDGVETVVGSTLDVIIVGANPNISKVFYAKPFDGNLDVRPDCFSNDGVRPDVSVTAPVSPSCHTCPHNVLGSKINPSGAKSKMCGDQRHLAVVPAADPNKAYALTISVSSMKGLREYFKELQNFGLSPEEVVTELGFDDQASFPKVVFKHKGYVSEKAISRVDAIVNSEEVKEVVRLIPVSSNRGAGLAAPEAPAAIEAPVAVEVHKVVTSVEPEVLQASKPPAVEKSEPVSSIDTSALEKKLDSLFSDD